MKYLTLLLVALAMLTACGTESSTSPKASIPGILQSAGYYDVTVQEASALLDSLQDSLIVIDVSPHWAEGHLPGAISLPLGTGALTDSLPGLPQHTSYLIYCHADSPAQQAAAMVVASGREPVYRLIGNYAAWVEAGYPIETP